MAATYYEKNPGGLVATGQRTVSTFPSGLCRIDRTYVCAEYAADDARMTLQVGEQLPNDDGKPTIDGAWIFPAPQETRRGDGFVEFAVSAYGRTSEVATITNLEQRATFFSAALTGSAAPQPSVFINCNFWEISGTITLPILTSLDFDSLNIDPTLLIPFDFSVYGYPTWKEGDVEIVQSLKLVKDEGGGSFSYRDGKEFSITFEEDAVEITNVIGQSYFLDPYTEITATRSFGKFKELDFRTTRDYLAILQTI